MFAFLSSPRTRIALACSVIVIVLVVIFTRSARTPAPQTITAWGGSGIPLTDANRAYTPPSLSTNPATTGGVDLDTSKLAALQNTSRADAPTDPQDAAFQSVLSKIAQTPPLQGSASNTSVADAINAAFASVPQFQLSASGEGGGRARTPEQEHAFDYGNRAGAIVKAYESSHENAIERLKAFGSDYMAEANKSVVREIGAAISKVGIDLAALADVPESARVEHARFAAAYKTAGEKLSLLADATDDASLLAATNTYNDSVKALIQAHLSMITYFSLAGVQFSSTDGGSVFSFSGFGNQ